MLLPGGACCAIRTARPRLVRVPRAYRAWGPEASCPAPPQVVQSTREAGTRNQALTHRREALGRTCQHGLLRMILMHTIPPVRMSKHWTARLKTPEPRYSTMRYRPAMTVPTSMGKLTVSSSPFRFGSKTTLGLGLGLGLGSGSGLGSVVRVRVVRVRVEDDLQAEVVQRALHVLVVVGVVLLALLTRGVGRAA